MKAHSIILCLSLFITLASGVCHATPKRKTVIPKIAHILGIRVGYNGREVLEGHWGRGKYTVGDHPNSNEHWRVLLPKSVVETFGVASNRDSVIIEVMTWTLSPTRYDKAYPAIPRLPHHSGWMGKINLGMTMQQVERLTHKVLPSPSKKGEVWTWKARGYVRPSNPNGQAPFTKWTAQLTFSNKRLIDLELSCD